MNILYVLPISWGGIPHYTAELANSVSRYANVTVLKPKDNNDKLFSENIDVISLFEPLEFSREKTSKVFSSQNVKNLISFKNIKEIENIKPDLIHFPELYPQTSIPTFIYGLDKKYPLVSTLHETFESPFHLLDTKNLGYSILTCFNRFIKHLVKSNKIIVHSERNKDTLIKKGKNPKDIHVIPHGAFTLFKKYNKEIEEENNCILLFGRLGEGKGIEYLIKSIPLISKEVPDVKLIIAGEGDLSKYSKYIVNSKLIEVHDEFIPNEKVSELFQRAKVVVLPYTDLGSHSGVLTIAFSFGKPVVVTNVGDFPKLVKNREEGLIVPPKDSKALVEAIIEILQNDKLRKRMSIRSSEKAEELSWDNIAKMHMKVYEEVLDEWRRKRN